MSNAQLTLWRNRRQAGGFTLVELMTVIAIISLLMAMLLPALGKAREVARGVKCGSQLRQIALATEMYANDNRNLYPIRVSGGIWPDGLWPDRLEPYDIRRDFLLCPSDKDPWPPQFPHSYIINGFNDFVGGVPAADFAMNRTDIIRNSDVILFGEKRWDSGHFVMDMYDGFLGDDFLQLDYSRHLGTSENAFVDGSVRAIAFPHVLTPVNLWGVTPEGRVAAYTE